MRITFLRLLAHCCCVYLLLSFAPITTVTPAPTNLTLIAPVRTDFDNNSSQHSSFKGKCQFNLTGSSLILEAESSTYQHRGFSQCEYIIQAPSSRFILLNFTDIHSQSDMPVEPGVLRQHYQQAAAETTTSVTESAVFKIPLQKPLSDKEGSVNITSQKSYRVGELFTTVLGRSGGSDFTQGKNSHNSSTYHIAASHSASTSHGDDNRGSQDKTSSEGSIPHHSHAKEIVKSSRSSLNKQLESSFDTGKGNYLELSTQSGLADVDKQAETVLSSHNCSLKLIIEEVNSTSESNPQVICWGRTWQHRIPIVFQYSVPIRIIYVWDRRGQSGFSLDFSFLRPEEVGCLFRCNNHLCLPQSQLCDGYTDCPDHSDELNSACLLTRQQQENGEPHIIKVIVIIVSVIIGLIIVLSLVLMINHIRCRNGARRGGGSLLRPPHPQSSEMCQSSSGSAQESGHYEALLHQHRQQAAPTFTTPSFHCVEHQQLLQQQQQQQCCHVTGWSHCTSEQHRSSQEHQIQYITTNSDGGQLSHNLQTKRPLQYQQPLQQKCVHHQHREAEYLQRQCRQACKQVCPSKLYPPNIPLSADGEEGYAMSQKALHSKEQRERNWQVENELFRPPPNKTVYDRDSPPPPYSLNPPGTKSLDSLVPPVGVVCVLRQARSSVMPQGSPTGVPRSHSLSCHH